MMTMTGAYHTRPLLLARDRNTKEISLSSLLLPRQSYQVASDFTSSVKTRKMTTQYLVRAALKTHNNLKFQGIISDAVSSTTETNLPEN
jgi:hypothetical protein